jgi:sphinganine-1-phosphate aldolase
VTRMTGIFNPKGISWDEIEKDLSESRKGDRDWRNGRVPLYVFHADDQISEISKKAYLMFFSENSLGSSAFPSVASLEQEVIRMVAQILRGDDAVVGDMTSGGTESIFLALKTARDWARERRPGIAVPEIVVPRTAHPAFNKAAHYLCMNVKRIRESADFRADVAGMEQAITRDTIMIAGSAPSFPHGVIDPIGQIAEVAEKKNLWLHVDACVGGMLAPFVKKLGYPVPDFDFSIPGVASISVDLHKYGFSAKPASSILFRNKDYHQYQKFTFEEWPSAPYSTQTFAGTRPSGAVASAWAVMKYLGEAGYLRIAREIMEVRRKLIEGITGIPGLKLWGQPDLSIIGFGSETIDIHAVGDEMDMRGWFVARNIEPPALTHMLMPVHAKMVDPYLSDLRESLENAKTADKKSGKKAMRY